MRWHCVLLYRLSSVFLRCSVPCPQWSYSRAKPQSGSVYNVAWTSDGTQLAGAGANGAVVFGQLVGRWVQAQPVRFHVDWVPY